MLRLVLTPPPGLFEGFLFRNKNGVGDQVGSKRLGGFIAILAFSHANQIDDVPSPHAYCHA